MFFTKTISNDYLLSHWLAMCSPVSLKACKHFNLDIVLKVILFDKLDASFLIRTLGHLGVRPTLTLI